MDETESDLIDWMMENRTAPDITEIRMTVVTSDGQKWDVRRTVPDALWAHGYPWVRGQEIRRAAEQLAEEVERAYFHRS